MPFGIGIPTKKKDPPKDDLLQSSVNSLISHPEIKMDRRAETAPEFSPMLKNRKREDVELEGRLDEVIRVPRDLDRRHNSTSLGQHSRFDSFQDSINSVSLFDQESTSRKTRNSSLPIERQMGLAHAK